jgi:hypothetical protein
MPNNTKAIWVSRFSLRLTALSPTLSAVEVERAADIMYSDCSQFEPSEAVKLYLHFVNGKPLDELADT